MNEAINKSGKLIKLTGTIKNYKCTREVANFVFTDSDRTKMGVIAIAAGIAGLGGAAVATASNATSTEEEADYVEFDLDEQPVKGWIWRSPFKEGDQVEVAAEWVDNYYKTGGIARPSDRTIALYPHCSRGKMQHIKNSLKWWFLGVTMLLVFGLFFIFFAITGASDFFPFVKTGFHYMALGFYVFFGLMTIHLTYKWMPYVRLSEKVFRTLGFPDPGNTDLVKSSKAQRKPSDSGGFGTFYFRY
jgi:hypothetical protein